jgi:hypothetical protein
MSHVECIVRLALSALTVYAFWRFAPWYFIGNLCIAIVPGLLLALLIISIVEAALAPWSTLKECVLTYGLGTILGLVYSVYPEPVPQVGAGLANVAAYISIIQAIYTYTLRCSPFLPVKDALLVFAGPAGPEDVCPICTELLEPHTKRCTCTPCGHWFHERCIQYWCSVNASCPMCRRGL